MGGKEVGLPAADEKPGIRGGWEAHQMSNADAGKTPAVCKGVGAKWPAGAAKIMVRALENGSWLSKAC